MVLEQEMFRQCSKNSVQMQYITEDKTLLFREHFFWGRMIAAQKERRLLPCRWTSEPDLFIEYGQLGACPIRC